MPTKTDKVHRLPLRIPQAAFEQLEAVATRHGLNVSDYVREAIAGQMTRDGIPTSGQDLQIGQHGGARVPSPPERTAMPKIIQSYPEELLEGRKTAILAPASRKDQYLYSDWESFGEYAVADGTPVEGVRLMGIYEYQVGDTVAVYGVAAASGPAVCYVRIESIELVNNVAGLTDAQHHALGKRLVLPETERRGWFMRVSLAEDGLPPEEPSQPSGDVTIHFLS